MQVPANSMSNFSQGLILDQGETTVFHGADYKSRNIRRDTPKAQLRVKSKQRVFELSTVAQFMDRTLVPLTQAGVHVAGHLSLE